MSEFEGVDARLYARREMLAI